MKAREAKKRLLRNAKLRKEYEKFDIAWEVTKAIVRLRIFTGITQMKLARLMGTKQSAIARAESGSHVPSLPFLVKMAEACGTELIPPTFKVLEEKKLETQYILDGGVIFSSKEGTKVLRDDIGEQLETQHPTGVLTINVTNDAALHAFVT